MSLPVAQAFAWSLATTLMACITLFKGESGYGVVPTADYEGDPETIVHVYDPFC